MVKILLNFDEIVEKLDIFFIDVPTDIKADLTELIFKKSQLNPSAIQQLQEIFKIRLPQLFANILMIYDFGDLTLGGITFGYHENYVEYLIKRNIEREGFLNWWGIDSRPYNYLAIADSDGFVILLNTETGEIASYERINSYLNAQVIASDFMLFLQAAASIYIWRKTGEYQESLIDIPRLIGSVANNYFWEENFR